MKVEHMAYTGGKEEKKRALEKDDKTTKDVKRDRSEGDDEEHDSKKQAT